MVFLTYLVGILSFYFRYQAWHAEWTGNKPKFNYSGALSPGIYWISFAYLIICFLGPHWSSSACVSKVRMRKSYPWFDLNKQKGKWYKGRPMFHRGQISAKSETWSSVWRPGTQGKGKWYRRSTMNMNTLITREWLSFLLNNGEIILSNMHNMFLVTCMQSRIFALWFIMSPWFDRNPIIRDNKTDNKHRPPSFLTEYKLDKNFPFDYMLLISTLHVGMWKSNLFACCNVVQCITILYCIIFLQRRALFLKIGRNSQATW